MEWLKQFKGVIIFMIILTILFFIPTRKENEEPTKTQCVNNGFNPDYCERFND